jgi:predicted RNA binding protein YcfA (HicA-like mRNA interferase family)
MKIPRDLTGEKLAKILSRKLNYNITRQKGSHIRLTTIIPHEFHITVPNHSPLKIGTLSSILSDIALNHDMSKDALIDLLFD